MSEISSGLVASIYLAFSDDGENIRFWTSNAFRAVEWAQENWETEAFVRLSDAEAIVAAKDAEIAAWKNDAINGGNAGYLREVAEHQAERIKELETQFKQTHEWLCDRNQQIHEQSAALRLAKAAFSAINIEAKTFMSYENARNNFSDDTDERKAYERAMVKASELTKKAIAAINVLKGE